MRRDPIFKINRTCRMCANYGPYCCEFGDKSRNPRARAIKCRLFENLINYSNRMGEAFFGRKEQK